MPDIEPVESGDRGVSIWTVVAVVVGVLVLVSVPAWFLIQSLLDSETSSTESTGPTAPSVDSTVVPVTVGESDSDTWTLSVVMARGSLRCGVGGSHPGFSVVGATSSTATGFDADFCRAVAAAVLGDADSVVFIPVSPGDRFEVVRSGAVDVLFRTTTQTLNRDATLGEGLDFGPTVFYDGQRFMGRSDQFTEESGPGDVSGARLCVRPDTAAEAEATEWAATGGSALTLSPLGSGAFSEEVDRLVNNGCDLLTTDGSGLAAARSVAVQNGTVTEGELVIFPSTPITREPLAPGYRQDDSAWADIVTWAIYATIISDENGLNKANIDTVEWDSEIERLFGVEGDLVTALGLNGDAFYQVIKQVGNYKDIYERNLGPLGLERKGTPNASHTDGGLIYAPPAR